MLISCTDPNCGHPIVDLHPDISGLHAYIRCPGCNKICVISKGAEDQELRDFMITAEKNREK